MTERSEKLVLHFLRVLFWLPAVLLPLLVLELSPQLWRQSSERVKQEEEDVELVEAASVKPEESRVKTHPGLDQELQVQVKKRSPFLPLCVKESQLQVEFRMSTNRPNSEVLLERREVLGERCSAERLSPQFQTALAQLLFLPIQRHCVKHFAISQLARAACAQHAVSQQQVKTPLELAQSNDIATLGATLLSKSGFPVAQSSGK